MSRPLLLVLRRYTIWWRPVCVGTILLFLCAASPVLAEGNLDRAARPVTVEASYVVDLLANRGGIEDDAAVLARGDLTLAFELEDFGLPGAELFVDLMAVHGDGFSERSVGDGQVVSNIEAPAAVRPIEAWLQMPLTQGSRFKLGLIDLNAEFDVQDVGSLFLNSSHGIGPEFSQSGINGPSIFPITSVGAIVEAEYPGGQMRVGVFDALAGGNTDQERLAIRWPGANGALLVGEVDLKFTKHAIVRLGAWRYGKRFVSLGAPGVTERSWGSYAMIEGCLLQFEGERSLDAWVRAGVARDTVNPIASYWGGGTSLGDEFSRFGVAVAHARLGNQALRKAAREGESMTRAETAFELTWSRRLGFGFSVQPNIQYVLNPAWQAGRQDAWVAGLRLSFGFRLL